MMAERQHLKNRHILFDFMLDSVTTIIKPDPVESMQFIENSIVFAHYYDATALDLILRCIAGNTPIIVNPHASIREYLGDDYPLYYYSYNDAARKAADTELVRKAHEHLRELAERYKAKSGGMANAIKKCIGGVVN